MKTIALLALLAIAGGCMAPRVVIPEVGAPLRAGPDLRGNVYVWTADKKWELSGNDVRIPEGWYLWNPDGTNGLTRAK